MAYILPILSVVTSIGSAAMSVYSGYQQARQERAMGKAQQRLATYNAQVAEAQMKTELQSGNAALRDARIRAEQIRDKMRYAKASQQAALAKAGVVGTEGTPLLVAGESAMNAKLRSLEEIWQGKMEKREHVIKAGYYKAQAGASYMEGLMARKAASQRAKSYILSGWSNAIGSLGSASSSAYEGYSSGAFKDWGWGNGGTQVQTGKNYYYGSGLDMR